MNYSFNVLLLALKYIWQRTRVWNIKRGEDLNSDQLLYFIQIESITSLPLTPAWGFIVSCMAVTNELGPGVGGTWQIFPILIIWPFPNSMKILICFRISRSYWQVSPQLRCNDTWLIWAWFKGSNLRFYKSKNFYSREINESWWRHQMETFSALLAICAGNSPVPGEFPTRPVTRSFDVFFDLRLNKRLSKQWWGWWFKTLSVSSWRHRNVEL